jgi:hypothetical protein
MIIALLSVILAIMLLLHVELRWQARQREDLTRMLILALFRISRKQLAALEAQRQRGEALSANVLRPHALGEPEREAEESHAPRSERTSEAPPTGEER